MLQAERCCCGMLLLQTPQDRGDPCGSAASWCTGCLGIQPGAGRPWQVKHHWQDHEISEVSEKGSDVCGAAEQEACPLPAWEDHEGAGVGNPNFLSVPLTSPMWFQENAGPVSVVPLPSIKAALRKSCSSQASHNSGWAMLGLGRV